MVLPKLEQMVRKEKSRMNRFLWEASKSVLIYSLGKSKLFKYSNAI